MTKTIKTTEGEEQYILDHKELHLEIGGVNKTHTRQNKFEHLMGWFNEEKACWIFPSPIDAIRVFQQLT